MEAYFNRFSISMTKDMALSCSHQGACDEDVAYAVRVPRIRRQLDRIDPEDIRAELKETGAWDAEELSDDENNRERIVWIAAGNIKDEMQAP